MGSLAYTIATFEDTVREIKAPPLGGRASAKPSLLSHLVSRLKKVNNFADLPFDCYTLSKINQYFDQRCISQLFLSFLLLSRRFLLSSAIF